MDGFIPKEKLSKKARKALDGQKRVTWSISPITRKVDNKKIYSRKKRDPEMNGGAPYPEL